MNTKLNLLLLVGFVLFAPAVFAQDNPAAATNAGAVQASEPAVAAPAVAAQVTSEAAASAATNPAPAAPLVATNQTETTAPVSPAPAVAAPVTNEAAASAAANTAPAVALVDTNQPALVASTNAPAAVAANSTVIPLIQFVDVPLTAAIENLARQANLNYILDPKIGFGQPGPEGKTIAQPSISIRWENLTAEQALYALLNNYDLQLVQDSKTKIARVAAKDPAAPDPLLTKVIQLKYASPSNILASVQSALTDRRSRVVPDVRTSQLVLVATDKEIIAVSELVERLDTITKQVLIESKILETTVNPKSVKGIDWSGTLQQQNVTFGNGKTAGNTTTTLPGTPATITDTLPSGRVITTTTTPGQSQNTVLNTVLGNGGLSLNTLKGFSPQTAFLNADGASAALSFLNNSADTKVISEPRTVTLDNQKSLIEVGLMYPIVNTTAGTANTTGGSSVAYSNLTVNLEVTPRITANNFVELKVQQSVLRLGPTYPSTVGGLSSSVNSFFTRKVDTVVLIPSGNTLVMGGLVSDENTSGNTKVPLLGDIPFLGLAFRKDTKERNRQNLIVFITPTIVKDTDFQAAQSKFLQSTGKESATEDVSPWNSGKPYDWTKPFGKKSAPDEQ